MGISKKKQKAKYKGRAKAKSPLPPKRGRPVMMETLKKKTGPVPLLDGPLGALILQRIAGGESLAAICREDGMPEARTVQIHVLRDPEFAVLYDQAKSLRNDIWAEELKEIGANELIGTKTKLKTGGPNGAEETTETYDAVDRARLHSDNIKWLLPRFDPAKYGDKLETNNTTDMNVNLQVRSVEIRFIKPQPLKVIDGRREKD